MEKHSTREQLKDKIKREQVKFQVIIKNMSRLLSYKRFANAMEYVFTFFKMFFKFIQIYQMR